MSKSIIGVAQDAKGTHIEWHVVGAGPGDYVTLCGMDGDDSEVGQYGTVEPKRGVKVDCPQCKSIWQAVIGLRLRRSNFA